MEWRGSCKMSVFIYFNMILSHGPAMPDGPPINSKIVYRQSSTSAIGCRGSLGLRNYTDVEYLHMVAYS